MASQSEILFEKSKLVTPGGVHSPVRAFRGVGGFPRFMKSAKGAEITDVDQNTYVDYCMSWGPLFFGHQDPEIEEALQAALKRGWTYGTADPYSYELSQLITDNIPWVEKIRFVNSGTEAVMAALRVARAATGRDKILKFDGCYHGHVDSMLVKAGSGLAEMASPDSAGVAKHVAQDTIVVPLDDLKHLERAFETHGQEIAAIIFEAIPTNNGLLLQREDFLKKASELAWASGSLVIFDEVVTGFRVGFGGMAEKSGIRPDLITYGKMIGGGFPVGAYGGRKDLMDLVAPMGQVYQAGTLSGNPMAMTAGLITLKKLLRDQPYGELDKKVHDLAQAVKDMASELAIPVTVQHEASFFWLLFGKIHTNDGVVRAPTQAPVEHKTIYPEVFHSLLSQGIYLAPSAYEISYLSTAHQPHHQEKFLKALRVAVNGK